MPLLEDLGLFYEDQGSGPPVVLLHGLALGLGLWDGQRGLAEEFRLIRYDARGAGRSPAPPAGGPGHRPAGDLRDLLDRLSIDRAHLVAHAAGGEAALGLALAHPERVASMVFVDSVLRGFPWSDACLDTMRRSWAMARERGVAAAMEEVWLRGEVFRWVRERRPEVFERVCQLTAGWSGWDWLDVEASQRQEIPDIERLHEVAAPVFVISGQEDAHDFVEIANMLTWWIPGARQKSLLGVGHFPMLENPYEFDLYLRGFLRSVTG
jgi:3-oxoadipate enol-lactonase